MQVGSFRIQDSQIIGPARFMNEWGKKLVKQLDRSGEVAECSAKWACPQEFALLVLLHSHHADWYAAQRFADGFDRGVEFATDHPPGDRKSSRKSV